MMLALQQIAIAALVACGALAWLSATAGFCLIAAGRLLLARQRQTERHMQLTAEGHAAVTAELQRHVRSRASFTGEP